MAVFNGEKYLKQAIESVLSQNMKEFEFIIIDDGSTDGTASLIQAFGDPRIVYHFNKKNIGQTSSLNLGLHMAKSALIARIDADDLYLQGKLQSQYDFMQRNPNIAVCGTWAHRLDHLGNRQSVHYPVEPLDIRFRLLHNVPVCHVSVIMRKEAVIELGGYDESFRFAADYELWSRLEMNGFEIANIPKKLTVFRIMPDSFGSAQKVGPGADDTARIIQKNILNFTSELIPLEECRSIALLNHPGARLPTLSHFKVHFSLSRLANEVYVKVPFRVRSEQYAALMWSLVKKYSLERASGSPPILKNEFLAVKELSDQRCLIGVSIWISILLSKFDSKHLLKIKGRLVTIGKVGSR